MPACDHPAAADADDHLFWEVGPGPAPRFAGGIASTWVCIRALSARSCFLGNALPPKGLSLGRLQRNAYHEQVAISDAQLSGAVSSR